jgi:flagellar basal body-associated protein FliL
MDNYPQYTTPPKPRKKLTLIVIGIIVFLLAIVGTVFALDTIVDRSSSNKPVATVGSGLAAEAVIEKVLTNTTVLASENYTLLRANATQNQVDPNVNPIIFTMADYPFITNITSPYSVRFAVKESKTPSDKSVMTVALNTLLTEANFTKVEQETKTISSYSYTSYESTQSICQIIDYSGIQSQTLALSIVCLSKESLANEYKVISSLLAKTEAGTLPNGTTVSTMTDVRDDKKLVELTVTLPASTKPTQYFLASLDSDLEYIGLRQTPNADDEASFVLSETLQKNVSDPKWGDFLEVSIE